MKRLLLLILAITVLAIVGCRLEADPIDVTVTPNWATPYDDVGVVQYDGRYSMSIDSLTSHWGLCAVWVGSSKSALPVDVKDTVVLSFIAELEQSYYFAIKSADAKDNWSIMSNILEYKWADVTPPVPIILEK